MRRLLDTIYILAFAAMAISCADDEPGDGLRPLMNDLGVISYVAGDDYFEITDDPGNVYIVRDNDLQEYYGVTEGKRLYFGYYDYVDVTGHPSIRPGLQSKEHVLEIVLERLDYVLSKPVIRESFILEDPDVRRDSIGYDGIRPYEKQTAWFGGDFINIRFEYLRYENSRVRHLINLVWDDVREPEGEGDDYVHLYLRHNAYGEVPSASATPVSDTGICSFNLSDMVPEGKESIRVKLFWDWYQLPGADTVEYFEDMGEFIPGGNGDDGVNTGSDNPTYYITPPENPTAFVF